MHKVIVMALWDVQGIGGIFHEWTAIRSAQRELQCISGLQC